MSNSFHCVGNGPHTALVLHGWFGDAHAFAPMEPWLNGNAFRYLFMNYRGYGDRMHTPGACTIDEIAHDALALADALDIDRFSLVGHSMGGMAIERIATLAPDRVRAPVAVAPVPCGGVRYDAPTRQFLEAAAREPEYRKAIIDRSTGMRLPDTWVAWKADYSAAHACPDAFGAYLSAWADTDFSDAITGTHPVKVLVGEHDPTFTAALMTRTYLRRYPRASLEILKNAGHYPMNETPLALVSAIESFLAGEAG